MDVGNKNGSGELISFVKKDTKVNSFGDYVGSLVRLGFREKRNLTLWRSRSVSRQRRSQWLYQNLMSMVPFSLCKYEEINAETTEEKMTIKKIDKEKLDVLRKNGQNIISISAGNHSAKVFQHYCFLYEI